MIRPLHLLITGGLLAGAFCVFARVRRDYEVHGRLSRRVALFQFMYFCVYASSAYAFLDSRFSQVKTDGWLFPLSLALMVIGLLAVAFSMPLLGQRSFGRHTGALTTRGIYRFSRNPQLVGCGIFIPGYVLLWPSWTGLLWAGLWPVITHLMVCGEEQHLERAFSETYREYCKRTPRYLGCPKR